MVGSVTAIIVNWHSGEAVVRCVASLAPACRMRPLRVVVVDNGSNANERLLLFSLSEITYLPLAANLGFAAACNYGARKSSDDYLFFVNPDIEALDNAIDTMAAWLDDHCHVAAVGGLLLEKNNQPQYHFMVKELPSLAGAITNALMLDKLPWLCRSSKYGPGALSLEIPSMVEQPAGACFMLRRCVFEALGGFDESFYPAWYEDVDLCRRLQARNEKVFFLPQARFRHAGHISLLHLKWDQFLSIIYVNQLRYFRKHHGGNATFLIRLAVILGMLLRIGLIPFYRDVRTDSPAEAAIAYGRVLKSMLIRQKEARIAQIEELIS